eukprot:385203_1
MPFGPQSYIGCHLQVFTKAGVRYHGTLVEMSAERATVTLQNVQIFGTEGRNADKNISELPGLNQVFKYLIFSGAEIQDLIVLQPASTLQADPAVLSHTLMTPRSPQYNNAYRTADQSILAKTTVEEIKKDIEQSPIYDFEAANLHVDKAAIAAEFSQLNSIPTYCKSSFYDDISTNRFNR